MSFPDDIVPRILEAVKPYGYCDVTATSPIMFTGAATRPLGIEVNVKIMPSELPGYTDRQRRLSLMARFEDLWTKLEALGLRLEDHPWFEIRGDFGWLLGEREPRTRYVYAEARFKFWDFPS